MDYLGRVDYTKQGGLHETGMMFGERGCQGRLYEMGRITQILAKWGGLGLG